MMGSIWAILSTVGLDNPWGSLPTHHTLKLWDGLTANDLMAKGTE